MAGNSRTPGQSVAGRVLSILGAFDRRHRALTLTEIATRTEIPVPTTHRLVAEMVEWGALVRGDDGRYVVGKRMWDLGLLAPVESGLRDAATPFMHDLHATTRATVHLAVREGTRVLYLDTLSGSTSVPVVSRLGSRLPMHATGVGKVLLAYAPGEIRHQALADLPRITRHTIAVPGVLDRQLRQVRQLGYATTTEEMTLGACSVGVPIVVDGEVVGALGVVVPTLGRTRASLVAALRVAAAGIARTLGDSATPGVVDR
ncbi:IclR family transcriptional regulator [Gordonia sp. NB41Y]|uniref:IclR family transcriptional regulator n=1 Tax=Gordonia sp. NB41Y TaxID=875808 RepID=UPI0006B19CF7|nr:IclR family transcriptional regulator [Gordonia sp. NB41Y]EMP12249.2 IclR family transcriptional regulator [Gordonia sp. NB41Y]WLP92339.1 IclR family transcriptional regulator [Gordonia sp. NB41Y]